MGVRARPDSEQTTSSPSWSCLQAGFSVPRGRGRWSYELRACGAGLRVGSVGRQRGANGNPGA